MIKEVIVVEGANDSKKLKAFFGRSIYLTQFKEKESKRLSNPSLGDANELNKDE